MTIENILQSLKYITFCKKIRIKYLPIAFAMKGPIKAPPIPPTAKIATANGQINSLKFLTSLK